MVTLAPESRELFDSASPYLWSLARDSQGTLYAGGGGANAKLFAIPLGGKGKVLAELDALEVHAMAVDAKDRVYFATSPDGKVYRLGAGGKPEVFYDPKTKYIWAMAFDSKGDLFVATGDHGEIHRVTPDGKGQVFFQTDETHVRSLAFDGAGSLIAGTDPGGLVLRISQDGAGFVLYQLSKREVTAVAVARDGAIYAAGVGNKQPGAGAPGLPPSLPAVPVGDPGRREEHVVGGDQVVGGEHAVQVVARIQRTAAFGVVPRRELAEDDPAQALQRARGDDALRRPPDAQHQVDPGAVPRGHDGAGHIAVGDQVDPGAGGPDLGDQLGVPGAIQDHHGDVLRGTALAPGHGPDVGGGGRVEVDHAGRLGPGDQLGHVEDGRRVVHGTAARHGQDRDRVRHAVGDSRVPSIGSTATSQAAPVPSPTSSPLNSIGAWSFSPSPMTTTPCIETELISIRIAFTAAPSAPFLSPRPTHRAAAIDAASVTRASSSARFRSGAWLGGSCACCSAVISESLPPGGNNDPIQASRPA